MNAQKIQPVEFVISRQFTETWKNLEYDDDDLFVLQDQILAWPKRAPVISGTGGVRKLRFAARRRKMGKRGGTRVAYVYFEHHEKVVLAIAYAKTAKRDLLSWEKKALKSAVETWDQEFQKKQS